jgi:hypothetical protein
VNGERIGLETKPAAVSQLFNILDAAKKSLKNLYKKTSGVVVLDGVSFKIDPGRRKLIRVGSGLIITL